MIRVVRVMVVLGVLYLGVLCVVCAGAPLDGVEVVWEPVASDLNYFAWNVTVSNSGVAAVRPDAAFRLSDLGFPVSGVRNYQVEFISGGVPIPLGVIPEQVGDNLDIGLGRIPILPGETRVYRVSFITPITQQVDGSWGCSGKIALVLDDIEYHPWFNSSWLYRTNITVNNTDSELTGYQIFVSMDRPANMSVNDIRVTNTSGDLFPVWVEFYNASHVDFWVNVSSVSSGVSTLYLYYGNAGAAAGSDGFSTFYFFDDFSGDSINTSKWTEFKTGASSISVNSGILYLYASGGEARLNSKSSYGTNYSLMLTSKNSAVALNKGPTHGFATVWTDFIILQQYGLATWELINRDNNGALQNVNTGISPSTTGYQRIDIRRNGTANSQVDINSSISSNPNSLPPDTMPVILRGTTSTTSIYVYVDFAAVRKYNFPEPVCSVDTSPSGYYSDSLLNNSTPVNNSVDSDGDIWLITPPGLHNDTGWTACANGSDADVVVSVWNSTTGLGNISVYSGVLDSLNVSVVDDSRYYNLSWSNGSEIEEVLAGGGFARFSVDLGVGDYWVRDAGPGMFYFNYWSAERVVDGWW